MVAAALALSCGGGAERAPPAAWPWGPPSTRDGPGGRLLLAGPWLLRRPGRGWERVTVPNAWNAGDDSRRGFRGGVAWYRKDVDLPGGPPGRRWVVRFDDVRTDATVFLDGRRRGRHVGGALPFEVDLGAARPGRHRLEVRVDNRRGPDTLPGSRLALAGGWWNDGGIVGEVALRPVDGLDFGPPVVRPELACRACPAEVLVRAPVRRVGGRAAPVRVTVRYGPHALVLGPAPVAPGRTRVFAGRLRVAHPRLWWPGDPQLYPVTLEARGDGRATYRLHSGIRSLRVARGRLLLNGAPTRFRGGFVHEDVPGRGAALRPADARALVAGAQRLGATVLRSHYPLSPYLHELADARGLLLWSEIPVYQPDAATLARPRVRALAARMLREDVEAFRNHPSVLAWSLGNELAPRPGPVEAAYLRRAAAQARRLDPSRPVALAIQGLPTVPCQPAYGAVDLLGVNEYFGWYAGPDGSTRDRRALPAYLDRLRACHPRHALVVTELGAEANRPGPPTEKGTYAFQAAWLDDQLRMLASRPWLAGAIVMLRAFRVRPGWSGGNPRPDPPMHEKGVLDYAGREKPAAAVVRRWFRATRQYGGPG
jgi:beta-glucuronidase